MKKVTFYLWLCDKDTKLQNHTTVEAYKIVMNLIWDAFGWGTISEWLGFYKHDDWTTVKEKSLIITTLTEKDYSDFVNTLKTLFNQESILVEVATINYSFD